MSETIGNETAVNKIVVAGRDAACWLSALSLMRAFGGSGVAVEVVELPTRLRAHDLYASLPALEAFHRLLGLEEHAVLKATSGTYSLGQSFANFSRSRPAFLHPYGAHGTKVNNLAFIQLWLKARQGGMKVDFEDFSLNAAAAKQGRFFVPSDKTNQFAISNYAYHLKALPYVQLLKAAALRQGVTVQSSRRLEVARDALTGHVSSLMLSDGSQVAGDLYIDATGTDSLLLGDALGVDLDSWRMWFGCDRVLTVSADPLRTLPVYSQVRALKPGCLHLAPLQDMTGLTLAYNSSLSDDDNALQTTAVVSNMRLRPDAVVDELEPGRRRVAWECNVVAMGEAACVFDPIDNVGLHAVHQGLAHLISLFPVDRDAKWERQEYNRIMASHFERLRDFQISHYKLNQNLDDQFWDISRATFSPDTLAYKIELFKARGVVAMYDDETFDTDNWYATFLGHGLMPASYDPMVDQVPDEQLIRSVQRMLGFIKDQVQDMTSHDAYLELYAARTYA